jgi:hypothetical protein
MRVEHELHRRRRSRNVGLGATLAVLIAVVFGLSVVKITTVGPIEAYDHVARPSLESSAE